MASYIPAVLGALLMFSHAMDTMANENLDFYYLVLMWPGAYCKLTKGECCAPLTGVPKPDFFVRGLLPYSKTGTELTGCNNCGFHLDELSDLEEDLYSYWSDITCPNTESHYLWNSTWETKGVCSDLTQHYYFKKSLDLSRKIDMLSILSKHGIIPKENSDYSLTAINKAITTETGVTVDIHCSSNQVGDYQMYEIYLCVDKDATTIIPCPVPSTFNCTTEYVAFRTFTIDMLKNKTPMAANPIRMSVPE